MKRIKYSKFQYALAQHGCICNVNVSQFYSDQQKRYISKYEVKMLNPEYQKDPEGAKKKRIPREISLLETYNYIELIKFLANKLKEVRDNGG